MDDEDIEGNPRSKTIKPKVEPVIDKQQATLGNW
jgi:hypothetical protein